MKVGFFFFFAETLSTRLWYNQGSYICWYGVPVYFNEKILKGGWVEGMYYGDGKKKKKNFNVVFFFFVVPFDVMGLKIRFFYPNVHY